MSLTKEQILAAQDIRIEKLHVPEWGGDVHVKALTAAERDAYEMSILEVGSNGRVKKVRLERVRLNLVSASLVDADGKQLFSTREVEALGKKSAAAINRIVEKAQQLSGVSDDDIEELADGLKNDQSADLPSD